MTEALQVEIRTLSALGFSAQGIVDLIGCDIRLVRAAVVGNGGRGKRKRSSSEDLTDRRVEITMRVLVARPYHYAIPHVGERIEPHGPVRHYPMQQK